MVLSGQGGPDVLSVATGVVGDWVSWKAAVDWENRRGRAKLGDSVWRCAPVFYRLGSVRGTGEAVKALGSGDVVRRTTRA